MSVPEAKLLPDGSSISLVSQLVTHVQPDCIYLGDELGTAGIRVWTTSDYYVPGMRLDITGEIWTTSDGERYITNFANPSVNSIGLGIPKPVGMNLRTVGGSNWFYNSLTKAGQRGLSEAEGLNNIGSLIKTWGNISGLGAGQFLLDDGSGTYTECIFVSTLPVYPTCKFAAITGISSMRYSNSKYIRRILVKSIDVIDPTEAISVPGTPQGNNNPLAEKVYTYTTTGAVSSLKHPLEYKFNWGDGTSSPWSTSRYADHAWSVPGPRTVTVTARCSSDTSITETSVALSVNVYSFPGSWEPTNGPYDGTVQSFVINSQGHIFAGTGEVYNGGGRGVYRSVDNGLTWVNVSNGLPDSSYNILTIDSSNNIFACTQTGIFLSRDNGSHWEPRSNGLRGAGITTMTVAPNGIMYAGDIQGRIFRSTDNAESWQFLYADSAKSAINNILVNPNGHIFLATSGSGVIHSTDNGITWSKTNTGLPKLNCRGLVTAANGYLLVGIWGSGVYRSTDNGSTWTASNSGIWSTCLVASLTTTTTGTVYAVGDYAVFRSTDNGNNWTVLFPEPANQLNYALAVHPSGSIFVGNMGRGILRSTNNGNTWASANTGFSNYNTLSMTVNSAGHVFAASRGVVHRTTNGGVSWTPLDNGLFDCPIHAIAINSSGHLFAALFSGGIYRSTDNGNTWIKKSSGLTDNLLWSVAVDLDGRIYASTIHTGGMFRSEDNAESWTKINAGISNKYIDRVFVSPTGDVFATDRSNIYRSTNHGDSWIQLPVSSVFDGDLCSIVFGSDNRIFAITNRSVYLSTNNGDTWLKLSTLFPDNYRTSTLAINSQGHLYAANGNEVMYSTDNGVTWSTFNSGIENSRVNILLASPDGHIYAGTNASRVYRTVSMPQ